MRRRSIYIAIVCTLLGSTLGAHLDVPCLPEIRSLSASESCSRTLGNDAFLREEEISSRENCRPPPCAEILYLNYDPIDYRKIRIYGDGRAEQCGDGRGARFTTPCFVARRRLAAVADERTERYAPTTAASGVEGSGERCGGGRTRKDAPRRTETTRRRRTPYRVSRDERETRRRVASREMPSSSIHKV